MDLITTLLNMVAPPATIFTLSMFVPPFYLFKLFLTAIRSVFKENVAGKVVLITGASSGIGEQLAYQYAVREAYLVLVARREDRLHQVAETARWYGSPDVLVFCADVSNVDECRRFVEEAVDHFGQLDHLVNNAGIIQVSLFEDATDVSSFHPIMDTNFWGSIYPTYFALPYLRRTGGKIVGIASVGGWFPYPRLNVYNASQAALINFYECLRTEVGSDVGITIVTPGYIESEITQGKYLSSEGEMEFDPEITDVQAGPIPIEYAEGCARGIVNGVCRGDRYITEPSWYNALYLWKVFCPEIVEWYNHLMQMSGPDPSRRETLGKKIMDVTGARNMLYPASVQSPEVKED